jgi:hypothetical protein
MLEGDEGMRSLLACSNRRWQQAHEYLFGRCSQSPASGQGSLRFSHVVHPTTVDCLSGAPVWPS